MKISPWLGAGTSINKGEKVFTSRIFPEAGQNGITLKSGDVTGTYFDLKY